MNIYEARCQCLDSCKNPPLMNPSTAPFCEEHTRFCPRKHPLNGYEPIFDPGLWNIRSAIRLAHNCFSYAMNIIDPKQIAACGENTECDTPFHQPGSISGYPPFNDTDPKTCPNMIARLMGDNPKRIFPSAFELRCPKGTSKIALIVDENQDYHFLRQDKGGFFSQKSGSLAVTNLDARGRFIFDVLLANHNFNKNKSYVLNYDTFCGYFCVDRKNPIFIKTS